VRTVEREQSNANSRNFVPYFARRARFAVDNCEDGSIRACPACQSPCGWPWKSDAATWMIALRAIRPAFPERAGV
jgi:hypothetical protein